MPLRKLSKTTSKKLSKHLATSAKHVGAMYVDMGSASWCILPDDIITTGSASKWDYRFGAFPLLGGILYFTYKLVFSTTNL